MDALLLLYPRYRLVLPVLTALAVCLFYLRVVHHFDYTPDDTYIYLRTAVNLVHGDGMAFNPGDGSYSVTGPLWALLVAGGTAVGLDPYIVAKTLDVTFAALAILALQLLVFSITESRILAALAAIMMTFDVSLLRWSATGMETSLAVLLTLLAFRYLVEGEWLVLGAALGLLSLVRPEYALLAPWMVFGTYEGRWREHMRRWTWPLLLMAAILTAWWTLAVVWTGTALPTTIGSKAGWWFDAERMLTALLEGGRIIAASHAIPVLAVGLVLVVLPRGAVHVRQRWMRLLIGWPLLMTVAYATQGVQVVSRYLTPALVTLSAAMMLGVALWLVGRPERLTKALMAAVTLVVLTVAANTVVYEWRIAPHLRHFTAGMQQAMKPIAFWLRSHANPGDEVLAPDIGMIGYVTGMRVWDPQGLATPALRMAIEGQTYDDVMIKRLYRAVADPRFVIDRAREPDRLRDASLRPIMTATMPELGVSIPGTQYVTLYEVVQ